MTSDHELGDRLRRAFDAEEPPRITAAQIRERAAREGQEASEVTLAATGTEGRPGRAASPKSSPSDMASEASDISAGPSLLGLEEDGRDLFGLAAYAPKR